MTKKVVALLNQAFRLDPEAIAGLVKISINCNQKLADHDTIICQVVGPDEDLYSLSVLGLLNGLAKGQGDRIVAVCDKTTMRLRCFGLWKDHVKG